MEGEYIFAFKARCLEMTQLSQENKLSITIIAILWAQLVDLQSLSVRVSNISKNQGMTDSYREN